MSMANRRQITFHVNVTLEQANHIREMIRSSHSELIGHCEGHVVEDPPNMLYLRSSNRKQKIKVVEITDRKC